MKTMYTIWQDLFEAHPFHGKGIAVKPECVIVINLMEYCFYPLVESWNSDMLQIARLIDGIVASDSVVVLIPRKRSAPRAKSSDPGDPYNPKIQHSRWSCQSANQGSDHLVRYACRGWCKSGIWYTSQSLCPIAYAGFFQDSGFTSSSKCL